MGQAKAEAGDITLPNELGRSLLNPAPELVNRRMLAQNQAANTPPTPAAQKPVAKDASPATDASPAVGRGIVAGDEVNVPTRMGKVIDAAFEGYRALRGRRSMGKR